MEWPLVGREEELHGLQEELSNLHSRGVVLAGDPGVGKTRLATELARIAEEQGRAVRTATATSAARRVHFGAFAHILPPFEGTMGPRIDVFQRALEELSGNAGDPALLLVDDAHLLDDGSAALLHQIAKTGTVFIVATVRSGAESPDAVAALWKDDLCVRFDIQPLSRPATQRLVERVLDGPVERRTHQRLWESSRGNVQYLRELLLGAMTAGALVKEGELWRLSEPLFVSPRLAEIVRARVERLGEDARRAVELLAVSEPLGVDLVERICGDVLGELEAERMVNTSRSGRRLEAHMDHPIDSEVIRASIPATRARTLARAIAEAVAATGARRRQDLMRIAVWSLEGVLEVDARLLVRAGRQAYVYLDHLLAERLARAALEREESCEALVLLGQSLLQQHRGAEAKAALDRAEERAETDTQRADVAMARADLSYLVERDPHRALEELRAAAGELREPDSVVELKARAALISSMVGDTAGVVEIEGRPSEPSETEARNLAGAMVASSIAQVMMGRLGEARETIQIGLKLAPPAGGNVPMAAELLQMNRAFLDLYAGRVDEAVRNTQARYEDALDRRAFDVAGMWAGMAAEMLTWSGDIEKAIHLFQESAWLLTERDLFGMLPMTRSGLARVYAVTGSPDKALDVLSDVQSHEVEADLRARVYVDRARIWIRALRGDLDGAVALARAAAETAMGAAHMVWAATLLHQAVRLGRGDDVADRLAEVAGQVEGELIPALARHARALTTSDREAMEHVSDTFERMGALVLASEAASQAAAAHQRAGDPRHARRWRNRATLLAARCRGAATPALAARAQLTRREQEVALLAAAGLASREIAGRLGVSVRTVDNHLASTYAKLGVSGRGDLAEVLQPEPLEAEPNP